MEDTSKELVEFQPAGTFAQPVELKERLMLLAEGVRVIKALLVSGEDYMSIPTGGGKKSKPFLTKAGGEKLASIYGYRPRFVKTKEIDHPGNISQGLPPNWMFEYECELLRMGDNEVVGHGAGSCSSIESKYQWRWVTEDRLSAQEAQALKENVSTLATREIQRGKGRNAYTIKQYRILNPEIWDLRNTILKMAMKRAFMGAVLQATRLSSGFALEHDTMSSGNPDPRGELSDEQFDKLRGWTKKYNAIETMFKGRKRREITLSDFFEAEDLAQEFDARSEEPVIDANSREQLNEALRRYPELKAKLSKKKLTEIPVSEYESVMEEALSLDAEKAQRKEETGAE